MEMKRQMAVRVKELEQKYGRVPHLVVVLVGEDPGSVSYVAGKAKAADEIGIRNTTIRRPETITEAEMLALIEELNADKEVDGIIVQLPLPKHIDSDKVIAAIDRGKDVTVSIRSMWPPSGSGRSACCRVLRKASSGC